MKMDEVRRHLDNTWFSWIGGTEPASVFYYRIHSPVILIEFDHQLPINLRLPGPGRICCGCIISKIRIVGRQRLY
jgi:uncharacterized protein DUF3500